MLCIFHNIFKYCYILLDDCVKTIIGEICTSWPEIAIFKICFHALIYVDLLK